MFAAPGCHAWPHDRHRGRHRPPHHVGGRRGDRSIMCLRAVCIPRGTRATDRTTRRGGQQDLPLAAGELCTAGSVDDSYPTSPARRRDCIERGTPSSTGMIGAGVEGFPFWDCHGQTQAHSIDSISLGSESAREVRNRWPRTSYRAAKQYNRPSPPEARSCSWLQPRLS